MDEETIASTPRADGFAMPAEFDAHQATWMSWPTTRSLWDGHLDAARDEWAATARAIAAFEPLVMVCAPGQATDVRRRCGDGVEPLEMPIDDCWLRDNGPIFVRNDARGGRARPLRVQLVGREVPALRRRRTSAGAAGLALRRPPVPGAVRPRGRVVLRRRRGHPGDHGAMPPASEPEPVDVSRGDRGGPPGVPRRRRRDLAPARARRGPRHRRAHRRAGAVRPAGRRDAGGRLGSGRSRTPIASTRTGRRSRSRETRRVAPSRCSTVR